MRLDFILEWEYGNRAIGNGMGIELLEWEYGNKANGMGVWELGSLPINPSLLSRNGLETWRQAKDTRWKLRFIELKTPTTRTYLEDNSSISL